jgi:G:T-mismatch repair DNA endonuclease (very short patch repair protein)
MKTCPNCNTKFSKNTIYCSKSCASQQPRCRIKPAWNKGLSKSIAPQLKGNTTTRTIETKEKLKNSSKKRIQELKNNQNKYVNYLQKLSNSIKNAYNERKILSSQRTRKIITSKKKNNTLNHSMKTKNKIRESLKNFYSTEQGQKVSSETAKKKAIKYWTQVKKIGTQKELHGDEWYAQRSLNISKSQSQRTDTTKNSTGEKELKIFLSSLNIPFAHDKYNGFNCRPDFYFKEQNKIIEYNGCYFHAHKCLFPEGYNGKDKRVLDNLRRTPLKYKIIHDNNIKLLEIWECDWKNNPDKCKENIKEFLK